MPTQTPRLGGEAWFLLVVLSLLWGGSFFFTGVAVKELPPFTIVALRVGIAALVLLAIHGIASRALPGGLPIWRAFLIMAVLNNAIPFTLLVWGQTQIASGLAAILNATTPLFTVVVANLFLPDERLTVLKLSGIAAGIAGVAVLMGPEALAGLTGNLWAQLACLGAALSYALAIVFGRRFAGMGLRPMSVATGQLCMSSLVLLPLALMIDEPWMLAAPSLSASASILAIAIASTALAYLLYFRILETAGATNATLVTFMVPPSAILLGALFLDERLDANHFIGMSLILLGLALIDGRLARRLNFISTNAG